VVFNTAHDVFETIFRDKRRYARTDQRLEFFFQLMSKDIRASIQHMTIVQDFHDGSCVDEVITNALWDPRFAALSRFSIRYLDDTMEHEYRLMDRGGVFMYCGRGETSDGHIPGPTTATDIEKLTEKIRLQEQERI
jgi:hypothetical protein